MKFWIYLVMSIFDLIVIAGFIYLVDQRDWSAWWMILMMVIIAGSSPVRLFKPENPKESGS